MSNQATDVDQFLLIYGASLDDAFGRSALQNTLVYSPGNLTAQNKDQYFRDQTGSIYARANYLYDHLVVTRVSGVSNVSNACSASCSCGSTASTCPLHSSTQARSRHRRG